MKLPNKEQIELLRSKYTNGVRVELVSMSDPYTTLKTGDRGTVDFIDDTGTVFVKWDNGSGLGAVYGEDIIRPLSNVEVIKEQTRAVAKTARTNMFDTKAVFEIALEMDYYELADFVFMNTPAYSNLILMGELSEADIIKL